jgi:hypothetical protein
VTEARAQQTVQQRRQDLNRANQQLTAAQRRLAACERGCGPLIAAVASAQHEQQEANAAYQAAVRAARIVTAAARELAATISAVESAVSGHASIATAALTDLERRLRAITGTGNADWLRKAWTALEVSAHLINTGHVVGELGQPFIALPKREVTVTEHADDSLNELDRQWLHYDDTRRWQQETDGKEADNGP